MAITNGFPEFTGGMGGMNSYLPKGRDKKDGRILRANGGASKKKFLTSPAFALVRLNCEDFGIRSTASKLIRMEMRFLKHLADYNIAPTLTSLCYAMQQQDIKSKKGERYVYFSKYGNYLNGFSFNKQYTFDSVVRFPFSATIDRTTGSAVVQVPALQPGINLMFPWKQPMYRLIITLGRLIDNDNSGGYNISRMEPPKVYYSPWQIATQATVADTITLQLDKVPNPNNNCMILGAGIEMGTLLSDAVISPVKNAGCAKILLAE